MNEEPSTPTTPVEIALARKMLLYALLMIAPALGVSAALLGLRGVSSSAYASGIVLLNFYVSSRIIAYGASLSLPGLMGGGVAAFFFVLISVPAATLPVVHAGWMDLVDFSAVLLILHIVPVVLAARSVKLTIAYDGLRPNLGRSHE